MKTVVVYGKSDCCLCDEALEVLERAREQRPFSLVERDITTNDAWERAYFDRIPVVEIDGVEVFAYHVDEAELLRRLDE